MLYWFIAVSVLCEKVGLVCRLRIIGPNAMSGKQIDVFSLTDKELANTLSEYGATCGPIIGEWIAFSCRHCCCT